MTSGFDTSRFEALTFDCYGTLIDWEQGIVAALAELLGRELSDEEDERLLRSYAGFEAEAERGPFAPYRQVLRWVGERLAEAEDVQVGASALDRFAGSVVRWPAFPDSGQALRELGTRFRLAIVSNVDDDLFAASAERLGVDFDEVVTAQQVRGYKPGRAHFDEVLTRLDLPVDRVLHCAQSLYHDIAPARALGFTSVWINRRAGRPGRGATPPQEATPDVELPDLAALARLTAVPRGEAGPST